MNEGSPRAMLSRSLPDDVSHYLHMVSAGAEFRFNREWDLGVTYVNRRKHLPAARRRYPCGPL